MTCVLVLIWLTVFVCMIRAVLVRDILWPQKQEDREEGGWKDKVGETEDDEGRLVEDETGQEGGEEEGGSTLSRIVSALSQRSRRKRKPRVEGNV
jgi:hypothetical protein